jgi:hypothetical protein
MNIDYGRVLKGAVVPAAQNVTLTKDGVDGTYYSVTATGQATSSVTGRYNAFTMDNTGNRSIPVGLNTSTTTAGVKSGAVTVDNLDVTTQGGAGRGVNDANDVINMSLTVLESSNSSFSSTDTNSLTLDLGDVHVGDTATRAFSIFNVAAGSDTTLTAGLDLDSIVSSGDASKLSTKSFVLPEPHRRWVARFPCDAQHVRSRRFCGHLHTQLHRRKPDRYPGLDKFDPEPARQRDASAGADDVRFDRAGDGVCATSSESVANSFSLSPSGSFAQKAQMRQAKWPNRSFRPLRLHLRASG